MRTTCELGVLSGLHSPPHQQPPPPAAPRLPSLLVSRYHFLQIFHGFQGTWLHALYLLTFFSVPTFET